LGAHRPDLTQSHNIARTRPFLNRYLQQQYRKIADPFDAQVKRTLR
jgi:hypothetical protein